MASPSRPLVLEVIARRASRVMKAAFSSRIHWSRLLRVVTSLAQRRRGHAFGRIAGDESARVALEVRDALLVVEQVVCVRREDGVRRDEGPGEVHAAAGFRIPPTVRDAKVTGAHRILDADLCVDVAVLGLESPPLTVDEAVAGSVDRVHEEVRGRHPPPEHADVALARLEEGILAHAGEDPVRVFRGGLRGRPVVGQWSKPRSPRIDDESSTLPDGVAKPVFRYFRNLGTGMSMIFVERNSSKRIPDGSRR